MKIDDAIIDKVLNNGASVEEARLVAEWFATEEGSEFCRGVWRASLHGSSKNGPGNG